MKPLHLVPNMPAVTAAPADTKVLVSGANGFVAIWVSRKLLEKGYTVRGTVRTAAKGDHLKKTFRSYGSKFEVVVVEDITAVRSASNIRDSHLNRLIGWRV